VLEKMRASRSATAFTDNGVLRGTGGWCTGMFLS